MKYLISHRGNLSGKIPNLENKPNYIDNAIYEGFDVEIDVWYKDNQLYLGHDKPQYSITMEWIENRKEKLWVHCKNIEAIVFFKEYNSNINFFWHQNDDLTITSNKFIWVNLGKQPIKNSIAVMPEIKNDDFTECLGICSDYIKNYKK